MSTLTALARAEAFASGRAVPLTTVRHVHLSERPLVLVPLLLAGETAAPLAALVGTDRSAPRLLVVSQPRNRDQRFAFLTALARIVIDHVDAARGETETVEATRNHEEWERYADAPQIIVPNPGGVEALRLFGRSSRFRSDQGPYPVDPLVPVLGRYLTWFAEDRAPTAGSCVCLPLTRVLADLWATGQSALEDQHLGALLAWIDPPRGLGGAEAAALAEDPERCPPAGPRTDPVFDTRILSPLIERQRRADERGDAGLLARVEGAMREALLGQLQPTWDAMWQGIDLLRAVPPAASDEHRWAVDRGRFTDFSTAVDAGAPPQPRRDAAVTAARRLGDLERALEAYERQRALDDPLILARYRVTGEAFAGHITEVDAERQVTSGRSPKPRPIVQIRTADTVVMRPGTRVACPQRPKQDAVIAAVARDKDSGEYVVDIELTGGMGRKAVPEPGTVPEAGEWRCYATVLVEAWSPSPALPEAEATPWTHGGPPSAYRPEPAELDEEWQ